MAQSPHVDPARGARLAARASCVLLALLLPLLTQCGRTPAPAAQQTDSGAHLKPGVKAVPTSSTSEVSGLNCFECHTPLEDNPARVTFSHKKHGDYGAHCNFCHSGEDHAAKPPGTLPHTWGVSKSCKSCHDGQRAANTCRTCHTNTEVIKPASHLRPEFARGHGRDENTPACTQCHTQQWCSNCHGLDLPHPSSFFATHGKTALAKPLCGQCHDPKTCTACHNGLPMPHPPSFQQVHGRTDQRLCAKCHNSNFCMDCHRAKSPHASGFFTTHGKSALRNDPACAACHQAATCDSCHGLKLPHPAGFDQKHGVAAKAQPKTCAKCHSQATCNTCHGLPMPHPSAFVKSHGATAKSDRLLCGRCHQNSYCRDCHGTEMPHPSGFVFGHNGEATFDAKSTCMKCHTQAWCGQCHTAKP